jgi:ABC-type transporter MlaC component
MRRKIRMVMKQRISAQRAAMSKNERYCMFSRLTLRYALISVLICLICAYTITAKANPSVDKSESVQTDSKAKAASGTKEMKYYPVGSPTRAIQELDDMLDDFKVAPKGQSLTSDEEAYNRKLKQQIIHGTFDIRELSKLSLSKQWDKLTPAEQGEFVKLLTDLLEEKALFSKEQSAAKSKSGGKYFVVYQGHKFTGGDKDKSFVRTKVVIPSENIDITLNYRLKKVGNDWKIYDIIVDEASLVDNYRFQFDSIIKKHGYADLVSRMSKKLEEIRRKREG